MRKIPIYLAGCFCACAALLGPGCSARPQDRQALAARFFASLNRNPGDNLQAYRASFSFSAQSDASGAELCDADDYNGFQYKWSRLGIQRVALGPVTPLDAPGGRDQVEVLAYATAGGAPKVYAALFSVRVLNDAAGGRVAELVASPSHVSPTADYLGRALCLGK